ncbi:MAG: DUF4372 domain-containing protein [Verrucomicrobiales bacterium]
MPYDSSFVLSQVLAVVHRQQFQRCVRRHRGDYKVKQFTCRSQFICLVFAQPTQRESLRDIEACLNAVPSRWPQLGLPGGVARTTLAEANAVRDWRIYADLAQHLIRRARKLYASDSLGEDIDQTVYALDSTTERKTLRTCSITSFRLRYFRAVWRVIPAFMALIAMLVPSLRS